MADEENTSEEGPEPAPEEELPPVMPYAKVFFAISGRINRSVFWLRGILPVIALCFVLPGVIMVVLNVLGVIGGQDTEYIVTTDRGQIEVRQVSSPVGENIRIIVGSATGEAPGRLFLDVGFDVSLGKAAADLPQPLLLEKTIDAGTFRLTAIQRIDQKPYDGPIRWRLYVKDQGGLLSKVLGIVVGIVGVLLFVFFIWATIAINAKRCHDRGRSGWFQLINLIPLIGQTWLFIETGLLKGTEGENRFGADPLAGPGGT